MSTVTSVRVIGNRDDQEDRYCMCPIRMNGIEGHLLAVFDGHGGEDTAQYCRMHLGGYFNPKNAADVPDALLRAIQRLSKETSTNNPGTTLSAVCILESHDIVVAAVLGDSPVVIRKANGSVWTSTLHNVGTNEEERHAAIKRGALYGLNYISNSLHGPGIQLSRALGDAPLRNILSDTPEISVIESPRAIMVATDGVFNETYSDEETMRELGHRLVDFTDANAALNWRLQLEKELGDTLRDNTTIVLWKQ